MSTHHDLAPSMYNTSCQSQIFTHITYSTCDIPLSPNCMPISLGIRSSILDGMPNVPKNATFSIFKKDHAVASSKIIDALLLTENFTDFIMTAMLFRDRLPQVMFFYVLSAAMIHHKTFKGVWLPHPYYIMPEHFFTDRSLSKAASNAKEKQTRLLDDVPFIKDILLNEIHGTNDSSSNIGKPNSEQTKISTSEAVNLTDTKTETKKNDTRTIRTIKRDETGINNDPEHNLWYFREDIAINSFHWHWHTLYPSRWSLRSGRPLKNRKGELFFHMHHQVIQRYNADRLAFNMSKVKPFDDWAAIIPEGYFPHLYSNADENEYPSRPENMILQNLNTPDGFVLYKDNLTDWRQRIKEAIKNGFAQKEDSNATLPLNVENGTDLLGAMIESSSFSPDLNYYGSLHNAGHVMIAQIHDPLGRHNTHLSVMGYTFTSMRDPIFYRWHKFVDNLFSEQKEILPKYTDEDLEWKKIIINDAFVINEARTIKNELFTYYENRILDVSKGLEFSLKSGSVLVKIDHLNHDPFTYFIKVGNPTKKALDATVRIYLAPKNNEDREVATDKELFDQFFEMDVFKVKILPGLSIISRSSNKSTVALDSKRTWMNLEADPSKQNFSKDFKMVCNCGWPDHMLVPRGTKEGMPFYMLVYITDYEKDKVDNSKVNKTDTSDHCMNGIRMCGVVGELFPDKRPLGFPFDRKPILNKMHPYSRKYFDKCNMLLSELKIYHLGDKADLH